MVIKDAQSAHKILNFTEFLQNKSVNRVENAKICQISKSVTGTKINFFNDGKGHKDYDVKMHIPCFLLSLIHAGETIGVPLPNMHRNFTVRLT